MKDFIITGTSTTHLISNAFW